MIGCYSFYTVFGYISNSPSEASKIGAGEMLIEEEEFDLVQLLT